MDLVANPAYSPTRGRPGRLIDLAGHCLLGIRSPLSWSATGPDGPETVALDAQVAVNDPKTMVSILRGGGGIGVVPRFLAQAGLDDGSLEILLPAPCVVGWALDKVGPKPSLRLF